MTDQMVYTGQVTQDGRSTRDRIQDTAERLVLQRGFTATTVDQIIAELGITKGAFFHHFKAKSDLARALLDRFARADAAVLADTMTRAERLGRRPLDQLLIFVELMIELTETIDGTSGCLFAAYCYESGQFGEDMLAEVATALTRWRAAIADKLRAAAAEHPPRAPVDLDELADMFTVVLEGAYMMARVYQRPRALADQLRLYRAYLELLFDAPR
jgi:TetR/AcrR family transcriptional regulator, transcriptional repressor for nem operon